MLNHRRRRRDEEGQILVAVLAFIAFVGVMAVASLTFLETAFTQHQRTENTASLNTQAEGAARFAVSTVANAVTTRCGGPSGASNSFSPSSGVTDTQSYNVTTCIPDYLNSSPGNHCALCILSTDAGALDLNSNAQVMVNGEVVVNGGILTGNNSKLCSTSAANCAGTPEFIGIGGPYPADLSPFTPAPTTITPINDPLGSLPYPTTPTIPPTPIVPSPSITPVGNVLGPGTYSGLSISSGTVTLQPGLYIMTGDVSISGGGHLVATGGVTLFFTCSTTVARVTTSHLCDSPTLHRSGLDLSGNGQYQIEAPTSGPYKNIAIFYDRQNQGDLTGNTGLKINGNGTTDVLSGGIYAAGAGIDIGGQGGSVFTTDGRLVVLTANIHVGLSAQGLDLVGTHFTGTCDLYNASVVGTETVGTQTSTRNGQVVFVADPNHNCGGTRIVSFTYTS